MFARSTIDHLLLELNRDAAARKYWRERLAGFEYNSWLDCYCTSNNDPGRKGNFAICRTVSSPDLFKSLTILGVSEKARHILLLGTLGLLMEHSSSAKDVMVFTPKYSDALSPADDHRLIPLRMGDFAHKSFKEFIMILKGDLVRDAAQVHLPVTDLVDIACGGGDPLLTTGMLVEELQDSSSFGQFCPDMLFSFKVRDDLVLDLGYHTAKFDGAIIQEIADRYFRLLQRLLAATDHELSAVPVLSEQEHLRITGDFNETKAPYPSGRTIMDLFREQVGRTPDNIALRYDNGVMSYSELLSRSEKIACYLRTKERIDAGDRVGIMLEREEYLVPCIFGILLAGAVYVPVDPAYPLQRISYIVKDAGIRLLITRSRYACGAISGTKLLDLDSDFKEIQAAPTTAACCGHVCGQDLAYIIYTSGSTGLPKGVMIEHHSVINRLLWMQKAYPLTEQDVILQKTPVAFDVSVWELFWWSITGAGLSLLAPGGEKDPDKIARAIEKDRVTTLHFVPSMLNAFLTEQNDAGFAKLESLRQVFSSGEALKAEQVRLFASLLNRRFGTRLINLYGPTEATVDVSHYECDFNRRSDMIPIGRPIDNIRFYILDKADRIAPVNVPGELCIAGAGLARGYWNNQKLTDEKFGSSREIPGERIYRTGDIAKWLPDGNVRYLGRADRQLKLRGYRIELSEIETRLSCHPDIKDCTVIARGAADDQNLTAFYTADKEIESRALIRFLSQSLPEYMIPSFYMRLQRMPLTQNGKLDTKALPDLTVPALKVKEGPVSEMEEKVIAIWALVLKMDKDKIATDRTFFEMGGNSLKLIRLTSMINDSLGFGISIAEMLRYPTISTFLIFLFKENGRQENVSVEAGKEMTGMRDAIAIFNNNL